MDAATSTREELPPTTCFLSVRGLAAALLTSTLLQRESGKADFNQLQVHFTPHCCCCCQFSIPLSP